MVKIYKNRGKGGNGEMVVETDATNVDQFISQLSDAIVMALDELPGDDNFTMSGIMRAAIPVAIYIAGVEYDHQRVKRKTTLIGGFSSLKECDLIAGVDR
jgi:hypothetical protein